jgi:hypothetical protein
VRRSAFGEPMRCSMPIRVSLPEPLALPLARLAVTPLAPLTP